MAEQSDPSAGEQPPAGAGAPPPAPAKQRLMRSRHARIISGVSGGIGEYLGIDPVLVRLAFVLLAIFGNGVGILIDLIAWVIIPLEPQHAPDAAPGPAPRHGGAGTGGLLLGLLLVVAGALWLIQSADIADIDGEVALAGALIGVGALLVVTLGRFASGPLITIGVIIAILLGTTMDVNIQGDGNFGERTERPTALTELESSYAQSFGSMTLDFTGVTLPAGATEIDATTTFGSLQIIVPSSVGVRIEADTRFGSVQAFGEEISGLSADKVIRSPNYDTAERKLNINLSSRFGSAEVIAR